MNQAKQSRIEFETWEYILPAIEEIAKVSAKGFAKYGAENWARVETKDNINHALRHLCLYRKKMQSQQSQGTVYYKHRRKRTL